MTFKSCINGCFTFQILMSTVRLSVNSILARKAAVQQANKLFHNPNISPPLVNIFCSLNRSAEEAPSELEARLKPEKTSHRGSAGAQLLQHCPIHQLIPSSDAPLECIHCHSPVEWNHVKDSCLSLNMGKGCLVAVCRDCRGKSSRI